MPPLPPDTVAIIVDTNPPQAQPFFRAIGYAIATWQRVELSLCNVFVTVSTCRDELVASGIFYSVRDFSLKLQLFHHAGRLSIVHPPSRFSAYQRKGL